MKKQTTATTPVSLYSTWWVKPAFQEMLKPALQKLARDILENETGTLMYLVHSPRYDFPSVPPGKKPIVSEPMVRPGTLVFVEKYASWNAFEAHVSGPYFTEFVNTYKDYFVAGEDGEPFIQVVFMNEDAGFASR